MYPKGTLSYTPFINKDTEDKGPGLLPGELLGPDLCILLPAPHWTQPGLGRGGMLRGELPGLVSLSCSKDRRRVPKWEWRWDWLGMGDGDRLFAGQ